MQSVKRFSFYAVAIAALLSFGAVKTFAQKIGWIDGSDVLTSLDDTKKADEKIKATSKIWNDSLDMMKSAAQTKADGYTKILSTMSEDAKQKANAELNQMGQAMQAYQNAKFNQNDGELVKMRNDLLKPILDKVHNAVVNVAKKKKLDFVLAKDSFVFPQTSSEIINPDKVVDITADVKASLK